MKRASTYLILLLICQAINTNVAFGKGKSYYEPFLYNTSFEATMPPEYKNSKLFTFNKNGEPAMVGECEPRSVGYDPAHPCAFIEPGGILAYDDSSDTAIVSTAFNFGGTGVLVTLYYIKIIDNKAIASKPYVLGDRILINSSSLKGDTLTLNMTVQGPNDPLCCPTKKTVLKLKYNGKALVKTK